MSKIIDTIIGSLEEKKAYKQNEARAKALPPEYATAYKEIQKYIFSSTGLLSMSLSWRSSICLKTLQQTTNAYSR